MRQTTEDLSQVDETSDVSDDTSKEMSTLDMPKPKDMSGDMRTSDAYSDMPVDMSLDMRIDMSVMDMTRDMPVDMPSMDLTQDISIDVFIPNCGQAQCLAGQICSEAYGEPECIDPTKPMSCWDIPQPPWNMRPIRIDNATVYSNQNPEKPYKIHCLFTDDPQDSVIALLPVDENMTGSNFSEDFSIFGSLGLKTTYHLVRLEIRNDYIGIDVNDTTHAEVIDIPSMVPIPDKMPWSPYGSALSCNKAGHMTAYARIDLRHTALQVDSTFSTYGECGMGSTAMFSANDKLVQITGNGNCGGMAHTSYALTKAEKECDRTTFIRHETPVERLKDEHLLKLRWVGPSP